MAIGLGRIMGFKLPENFNLPYASQSITEFWRRWHISLSTWLRDYLYVPLGGNRKGSVRTYINLMLTMLLGGLWHGASWNFVLWGGLHGSYLAVERFVKRGHPNSVTPWTSPITWFKASGTFLLVTLTWIFFRSPSIHTTEAVFRKLFLLDTGGFEWLYQPAMITVPVIIIGGYLVRRFSLRYPYLNIQRSYTPALILIQILFIYFLAPTNASPFIYFQF